MTLGSGRPLANYFSRRIRPVTARAFRWFHPHAPNDGQRKTAYARPRAPTRAYLRMRKLRFQNGASACERFKYTLVLVFVVCYVFLVFVVRYVFRIYVLVRCTFARPMPS